MQFADPLQPGRLLRRYKRFLADVALEDGREIVAHCANSGSMLGLASPGARVWLSPARNPARKLRYSWELVEANGTLVGINTGLPNAIAAEAIAAGRVPELARYEVLRREVRYGRGSRIDILLERAPAALGEAAPPCHVEVKSVTLSRVRGLAEFPDAVTARGTKHLSELAETAASGGRAVLFFLVQRADCERLSVAADIDPAYARGLEAAMARGLEVLAYDCNVSAAAIELRQPLALAL